MRFVIWLTRICGLGLLVCVPLAAQARMGVLMRYPTIHGDTIVFEAGGNLWKVNSAGGVARRLTADRGYDSHAYFSPDGHWIAFTGWYDGNSDVYVMPAAGGYARRLTYRSYNRAGPGGVTPVEDNRVAGWTPDGKDVVFVSRRDSISTEFTEAFEVPVTGGPATRVPLPWVSMLAFSPDGSEVAYNKIFRTQSFHRKHYKGGWAQKVWIYDFKTHAIRAITDWPGDNVFPMWSGSTIYYASAQDTGVLNLWSYDLDTGVRRRLTDFRTYDVDWPSLGNTGIVFQDGGRLYDYELPAGKLVKVPVTVPLDGTQTRPYWYAASKMIRSAEVAPNGRLAVFEARGNLFTVPAKHGQTADLTPTSRADNTTPAWSPDGKWIAYVTDITGQSQIAIRRADGSGHALTLTHFTAGQYFNPRWSPDGKWIAFGGSDQRLWVVDVKTRTAHAVAQDLYTWMYDYSWSPDSRWLAYSRTGKNQLTALWFYNVETRRNLKVSRGRYADSQPVFSRDGKYLFFVSARHSNPALSYFGDNAVNIKPDGLYVATLQASEPSPFAPRSTSAETSSVKKPHKPGRSKRKTVPPVRIDFTGLMQRAVPLPVAPANINALATSAARVFYLTGPVMTVDGPLAGESANLHMFDLKKRKDTVLVKKVSGFALSADGKTLLYRSGSHYFLRTAGPGKAKPEALNLSRMLMHINPVAEWRQMYWAAWRHVRDYFYSPKYNGYDWKAVGERYAKLLPLMACREDLNYLIGNMIGSLGESHMYIFGGTSGIDYPKVATGDLGADFALDPRSGRYYLARIYHGDNTLKHYYAPLAQPGLDVHRGDYVLAINGRPLAAPESPYALLINTVGTQVRLTLSKHPEGAKTWTVRVKPIANSQHLRLLAWIRHNRRYVDKLSGGKIGYVYLADMESLGMNEFIRQFYSELRKPGLIIDERWNEGGFIDDILFDRLTRRLAGMAVNRQRGLSTFPGVVYNGYLAAVVNHGSASDGDIFAYEFEHYHLGPVIGSRTWGGVRGLQNPFVLRDGGVQVVSEFAYYNLHSRWTVENKGVQPDIKVHDEPGELNRGYDAQLATAVHVVMKEIKTRAHGLPPPPHWLPAFPPGGYLPPPAVHS